MQPISYYLNQVTKPIFSKYGYHHCKLILDWPLIVGSKLAYSTVPKKLFIKNNNGVQEGILHIEVQNSSTATEIAYNVPLLIEKIAVYFGFKIVNEIKVIQNPHYDNKKDIKSLKRDIKPTQLIDNGLENTINSIEDNDLKKALSELAYCILSNKK